MSHLLLEENSESHTDRLPLFRPEVTRQQAQKLYGEIVLLRPVSLTVLLWLVLACIGSLAGFVAFGHYTSKAHASGVLLPDRGILKILPGQPGTLNDCRVRNGQQVRKGDVLFSVVSDRSTMSVNSLAAEIRQEMINRRRSLLQERAMNQSLSAQQAMSLHDRLDKVEKQQAGIAAEIGTAERQSALAEGTIERYRKLGSARLISVLDLQEKERAPLEQQKILQELRRSQIALDGERSDLQFQLQRIPLQSGVQSAALDRAISELDRQLSEHEATRAAVVRAPADGRISAVIGHPGMAVEQNTELAILVPDHARLEAHLYAPSRAVGFIKPGNTVLLRYRAYTSEQLGRQNGVVVEVSPVAISSAEYGSRTGEMLQEPMYELVALLPAQAVSIDGRPQELRAGMTLDADILLERRSLLQWFFEPIVAMKGRLAG